MKAITWLATVTLGVAVGTSCSKGLEHRSAEEDTAPSHVALKGWETDVKAGIARAKAENKAVLVEFTGSDWCPPCMVMRKNVFSKKEFMDEASKKFVLVEIDLPKRDKELSARNQMVAEGYQIDGFPTVLLLSGEGKEFSRFYAAEYPSVDQFLNRIHQSLGEARL